MTLILLVCYFIPAIVASCRRQNATGAIMVLNIFLGWTFIGWVIALVWASTNDLRKEPRGLRAEPGARVRRTLPRGNPGSHRLRDSSTTPRWLKSGYPSPHLSARRCPRIGRDAFLERFGFGRGVLTLCGRAPCGRSRSTNKRR
jgi:hypothetical protein